MSLNRVDGNGSTFVFETAERMVPDVWSRIGCVFGHLLPCFCGSILCVSFGIMLGWPSPTYPKLLSTDSSPIPITLDQSAMIAGFLMLGMVASTPFSSWSFLGTKYGIILGYVLVASGWSCMWAANNIYWLLGSRLLVGIGHGYGSGQLKIYAVDLFGTQFGALFGSVLNLFVFFGIVVAFAMGPYVTFEHFSLISLVITLTFLALCLFLPHTPKELCVFGRYDHAKQLLKILRPQLNASNEVEKVKEELSAKTADEMSFFGVVRNDVLRKRFVLFGILVFVQQFSGAPATVVYAQIIFEKSGCHHAEMFALIYAIVYFASNCIGVFSTSKVKNKRKCLLLSGLGVSFVLATKILVVYFDVNQIWPYTSLIVMLLYISIHTVGLATIPFTMIANFFPKSAKKVLVYYYIMSFSALALLITKIFQVLYDRCSFYVPFCLFFCISVIGVLFVIIFVPKNIPSVQNSS